MIADILNQQVAKALKSGNSLRVSTLRLLSAALHNEQIAKQKELSEEEELNIVRREIKKREEAIEAYKKVGREDAAEKEEQEAGILKEFLPAQLQEEELNALIEEVIGQVEASGWQDFGKVMSAVMAKVAGRAEGKVISEMVKSKLQR